MKRERTFSACARCLSNCSWRFARTACLIVASAPLDQLISQNHSQGRQTWVGNANCEQLVDDIADDLDGIVATLEADGVAPKDATAC
jgi:hypothetical protein